MASRDNKGIIQNFNDRYKSAIKMIAFDVYNKNFRYKYVVVSEIASFMLCGLTIVLKWWLSPILLVAGFFYGSVAGEALKMKGRMIERRLQSKKDSDYHNSP